MVISFNSNSVTVTTDEQFYPNRIAEKSRQKQTAQATRAMTDDIEHFCDSVRLHWALNYVSPNEYEQ